MAQVGKFQLINKAFKDTILNELLNETKSASPVILNTLLNHYVKKLVGHEDLEILPQHDYIFSTNTLLNLGELQAKSLLSHLQTAPKKQKQI